MPGVTDQRFAGKIVSMKPSQGYGFIQCAELFEIFKKDVFLHKEQFGHFSEGSPVMFGVFLNKQGQPQAKDLVDAFPASSKLGGSSRTRLPPVAPPPAAKRLRA